MREMKAGEFKAKCLAVMDEVAASREPVVITKRGKAIARLVPEPKDQTGLLEFLRNTAVIVDPNDDLVETFTPEELEEFDRHLMEEADEFRRLMSKFRDPGEMESMRERFVAGAVERGVPSLAAERVFDSNDPVERACDLPDRELLRISRVVSMAPSSGRRVPRKGGPVPDPEG